MKKIITILLLFICLLCPRIVNADQIIINDEINCLSYEDCENINNQLEEIANKYHLDIVIYLTNQYTTNITRQANDYYDSLNLKSGLILIINTNISEYDIVLYDDAQIIKEQLNNGVELLYNDLKNRDFANCCISFGKWIDSAYNSPKVDPSDTLSFFDKIIKSILPSSIISIVITLIIIIILINQLKTEKTKYNAESYAVPHSFKLTRSGDIFLYRNVIRHRKANPPQSHHSSSGTTSSGHSYTSSGGHKF